MQRLVVPKVREKTRPALGLELTSNIDLTTFETEVWQNTTQSTATV